MCLGLHNVLDTVHVNMHTCTMHKHARCNMQGECIYVACMLYQCAKFFDYNTIFFLFCTQCQVLVLLTDCSSMLVFLDLGVGEKKNDEKCMQLLWRNLNRPAKSMKVMRKVVEKRKKERLSITWQCGKCFINEFLWAYNYIVGKVTKSKVVCKNQS